MKLFSIILSACAAGILAQNGYVTAASPMDRIASLSANGLEQFADPDGCCLLPLRCGNGDGGERCERVSGASAGNTGNNTNTGKKTRKNNGNRRL
ncbi:hypothetical protein CGCVW01_v005732 [Colletotrichum viniferum]|nr:hypothetical protein CGCVW01_v005732 [Colletotrichum viniferum]